MSDYRFLLTFHHKIFSLNSRDLNSADVALPGCRARLPFGRPELQSRISSRLANFLFFTQTEMPLVLFQSPALANGGNFMALNPRGPECHRCY